MCARLSERTAGRRGPGPGGRYCGDQWAAGSPIAGAGEFGGVGIRNMENALYYTFSTIAQTLAGAIALLAAFALYRLQSLDNIIEEKCSFVFNSLRNESQEEKELIEKLNQILLKKNYTEFITRVREQDPATKTNRALFDTFLNILDKNGYIRVSQP